jgi:hypothetical protein
LLAIIHVGAILGSYFFLKKNIAVLFSEEAKKKYDLLYPDIDIYKNPYAIMYYSIFLLRRLLMTSILFIFKNESLQVLAFMHMHILQMIIQLKIVSFNSKWVKYHHYINEFILMITMYYFLLFTDFIKSLEEKEIYSY